MINIGTINKNYDVSSRFLFNFFLILPSLFFFLQYVIGDLNFVADDNIQALERFFDPSYLLNDFFTNSSSELNPRKIFIYLVIFITEIFYDDYFYTLFLIKLFVIIFLPYFVMLFFTDRFRNFFSNSKDQLFFTFIFALLLIYSKSTFVTHFSIGWWTPLSLTQAAQSLALTLGFASAYFINHGKYLGYFLFFCASLIHFPNAAMLAAIIVIFSKSIQELFLTSIILFVLLLASYIILNLFFITDYKLSSQDFIEYYVMQPYIHTHHYRPDWLGPYGIIEGKHLFYIYNIFFIIASSIAAFYKRYRISLLFASFCLIYFIMISAQTFFVETYPSRLVAAFGPSRFAQFGYLMMASALSLSYVIFKKEYNDLFKKVLFKIRGLVFFRKIQINNFKSRVSLKWSKDKELPKIKIYIILIVILIPLFLSHVIPNPRDRLMVNKNLHNWVVSNTNNKDVFAIPYPRVLYWLQFASITKRPVYYANNLAFTDKSLKESNDRKNLLYGKWEEWGGERGGGGAVKFYCNLTEEKILKAAKNYQLNYIIVDNKCIKEFSKLKKTYYDDEITIFKLPILK